MKLRTLVIGVLLALFVPLVVGAVMVLGVVVTQPMPQGDRVKGPHGIVGLWADGAYAWVVPVSEDEVLIIDAGADPEGTALRTEVGGRTVLATLVTHGHRDHIAGIDALPDARLYHGPGEDSLIQGNTLPGGYLAAWMSRAGTPPRLPEVVTEVTDGDELRFGSALVRVVEVPGHTKGSVAYLWRDVLFSGDALLGGDEPQLAPSPFATDQEQAQASLSALVPLDFEWLCDGHVGVRAEARPALLALLNLGEEEPTISVHDEEVAAPTVAGPQVGETAVIEGRYVQAPLPDARGLRPARLVDDNGRTWVISDKPIAAHANLAQRRVRVTGRPVHQAPGTRPVAGPWLDTDQLDAIDDLLPGIHRIALDRVEQRNEGWVEALGQLNDLVPLAVGSSRAVGHLGQLEVVAPSSARHLVGSQVTVLARVDGHVLLVEAVCPGDVRGCGRIVSDELDAG